ALDKLDTTTIVQPKKLTNPTPWISRLSYLNRIAIVFLSAVFSGLIAVDGPVYELIPLLAVMIVMTEVCNGLIFSTLKSDEFDKRLAEQKDKYAKSIRTSLDKINPSVALYHSGPVTAALTDAIATLKKS